MKKNLLYTLFLLCFPLPLLTAGELAEKNSLLSEQSISLEPFIDSLRSAGIYAHYQTMKQAIESLLSRRNQSLLALATQKPDHPLTPLIQEMLLPLPLFTASEWEELWMLVAKLLYEFFIKELISLETPAKADASEEQKTILQRRSLLLQLFYPQSDLIYNSTSTSGETLLAISQKEHYADPYEEQVAKILKLYQSSMRQTVDFFEELLEP